MRHYDSSHREWPGYAESGQTVDIDIASPLPEDPELPELVCELSAERDHAFEALKVTLLEVEKLKLQLARLRPLQFGSSFEQIAREADEGAVEEIEGDEGAVVEARADPAPALAAEPRQNSARQKPTAHLPRETIVQALRPSARIAAALTIQQPIFKHDRLQGRHTTM